MIIITLIAGLFFSFLLLACAYFSLFALASLFSGKKNTEAKLDEVARTAVLIPAYKEDAVILSSAQEALKQDFPKDQFEVVVITDSLQKETLHQLHALPITVIEARFEKSTKAKALNLALSQLPESFDLAVILDADNHMEPNALRLFSKAYSNGAQAIQGQRIAKNQNSPMAQLDGLSEAINNAIFRKGHARLGLSSALIGSGMAFSYSLFKSLMSQAEAVSGFDKELELEMISRGIKTEYLPEALIKDEKVQSTEVFARQRTRWIASQFSFAAKAFQKRPGKLSAFSALEYANKLLQFLLPPRIVLIGMLPIAMLASALLGLNDWLARLVLGSLLYYGSLSLILANEGFLFVSLRAILLLPKAFWLMFSALSKIKQAKNQFIHTPHHA